MTSYPLYSLCLRSTRPLWHVVAAAELVDVKPDIELFFSPADDPLSAGEEGVPWAVVREQVGSGWYLSLSTAPAEYDTVLRLYTRQQTDETTVIFGRNASQIWVRWRSAAADTEQFWVEMSGWILGSVLGYAMCLRGLPTLHGSVVAVDGQAVGLLGVSGAGKSTLAAAFVAAGHAMLADDHLVVGQDARGYCARPGPSRLRLWPSSLSVFDSERAMLPFTADGDGKRFVQPGANAYCTESLPLAAIYVLMPRDPERTEVAVDDLSPAAALNALMNQRFCTIALPASQPASTFAALSALVQRIPVRLLHRPHGLETLPAVVAAIQKDAIRHVR
jgi:hypothetical protein